MGELQAEKDRLLIFNFRIVSYNVDLTMHRYNTWVPASLMVAMLGFFLVACHNLTSPLFSSYSMLPRDKSLYLT